MAINPALPLMYAQQMGAGGRMVHEVATSPEATQAIARQMAETMFKEQSQQVQRMEDPALSGSIHEREHNAKDQTPRQQRRQQEQASEEPASPETTPSSEGPFLGNLVNRKI